MENTSKALLIAAAILIAIILITLGIKVLGSADDTAKQVQGVGDSISSATKDSTSKLESLLSGLGEPSKLNHSGVIPEGGIYVSKDGTTYNAGQEMPTPQTGDTYTYTDYIYTLEDSGWKVNVISKNKSTYANILENINGRNTTRMSQTFSDCELMEKAPKIPSGIKEMSYTFKNCKSLTEAPKIPSGVRSLSHAFMNCKLITNPPEIPIGVEVLTGTFKGCTSLKKAPVIPNTVVYFGSAFSGCTNLVTAPTVPESVIEMQYSFDGCKNLTGDIEINVKSLYAYHFCFSGTTKEITIKGKAPDAVKQNLSQTGTYIKWE